MAWDGVSADVAAVANGDSHDQVLVAVSAKLRNLTEGPSEVGTLRFWVAGQEVEVEIPRFFEVRMNARMALRPGQSLLMVMPLPKTTDLHGDFLAVVVDVEWVEE